MQEESEQDALWRATGELVFEFPIDNLPKAISQLEQENIVQALEKYNGNKTIGIAHTPHRMSHPTLKSKNL